jgi:agmatinase
VHGGFETEQVFYLLTKIMESRKRFLGFDLCEVGTGESDWDSNVGARVLFKLCNILTAANR